MQESRLSSIGLLAAGIAHNIRTPLTIIMGEASMDRKHRPEDETKKLIINQAEKIDKILDTMIIKYRKGQESYAIDLDLNELEIYLSKHSDAEFSYGICRNCLKELYPEQYQRMIEKGKLATER